MFLPLAYKILFETKGRQWRRQKRFAKTSEVTPQRKSANGIDRFAKISAAIANAVHRTASIESVTPMISNDGVPLGAYR